MIHFLLFTSALLYFLALICLLSFFFVIIFLKSAVHFSVLDDGQEHRQKLVGRQMLPLIHIVLSLRYKAPRKFIFHLR